MSRPYQIEDSEAWLRKAGPLKSPQSAVVMYQGNQVARLFAQPGQDLKQRAENFIRAIGYRGAYVKLASA